jgi:hypothetical protein
MYKSRKSSTVTNVRSINENWDLLTMYTRVFQMDLVLIPVNFADLIDARWSDR